MKFSRNLINFDESNTQLNPTNQTTNDTSKTESDYQKYLEQQKLEKAEFKKKYEEAADKRESVGANGIKHGYVDIGHELKKAPGKGYDLAKKVGKSLVRDAKEAYHGWKGEVADQRDKEGNPTSWKKKDWTVFKTEEDKALADKARLEGKPEPNNNAVTGTLGFRTAEVASPFLLGGAFAAWKLFNRNKRKKAYEALIDEGYSPSEAAEISSQVNNSERQTNFNVAVGAVKGAEGTVKGGLKWLIEHGFVAPFKGRKVTTAYNPTTGKIEQLKDGIIAKKDILDKEGNVITKAGNYVREGGIPGAKTIPGKIGMGAMGVANVGLTASLITMPASVAADFKRNAEYNKKYVIDPEKHYVLEQDLADNKKVRLIGKTSGYEDRTDANIEADRYAGQGMYQVYAIKGSELARTMPRKFTLEYVPNEY